MIAAFSNRPSTLFRTVLVALLCAALASQAFAQPAAATGDGKLLYDSRSDKAPAKTPYTVWMPPQAPHLVENLSKKPLRLLRVELKQ